MSKFLGNISSIRTTTRISSALTVSFLKSMLLGVTEFVIGDCGCEAMMEASIPLQFNIRPLDTVVVRREYCSCSEYSMGMSFPRT